MKNKLIEVAFLFRHEPPEADELKMTLSEMEGMLVKRYEEGNIELDDGEQIIAMIYVGTTEAFEERHNKLDYGEG